MKKVFVKAETQEAFRGAVLVACKNKGLKPQVAVGTSPLRIMGANAKGYTAILYVHDVK